MYGCRRILAHLSYFVFAVHLLSTSQSKADLKVCTTLQAAWKAFEGIKENGGAKAVGLISASMSQISTILGFCKVKPAVNSVEVSMTMWAEPSSGFYS